MRRKFFGDSYDITKRFLLETLARLPGGPWSVHPMFAEKGDARIAREFGRLMEVPLVYPKFMGTQDERRESLAECQNAGHLLLDPDTGISCKDPSGSRSRCHVYLSELTDLARARPDSVTAVFDQGFSRGHHREQFCAKLGRIRRSRLYAFGYRAHADLLFFLFLGANRRRVDAAKTLLLRANLPPDRFL